MSNESKVPPSSRVDVVEYCAAVNFEGTHNLYPENTPKHLREKVGDAVVMGTVHALFATDPEQRLTRQQLLDMKPSDKAGQILFEHCWQALQIPEPEQPFIEGVDQWERIEKTKKFLQHGLSDDKVWSEFSHYFRAVVDTDWSEIINRGTPTEKEWCIRVHVKFLNPVEDAYVLGALHLAGAELAKKGSSTPTTYNDLIHGKAPEPFRRQFAELFVDELGLKDRFAGDQQKWTEAVDYFDRAFGIGAFWEGGRPDAIASNFPTDTA